MSNLRPFFRVSCFEVTLFTSQITLTTFKTEILRNILQSFKRYHCCSIRNLYFCRSRARCCPDELVVPAGFEELASDWRCAAKARPDSISLFMTSHGQSRTDMSTRRRGSKPEASPTDNRSTSRLTSRGAQVALKRILLLSSCAASSITTTQRENLVV